MSAFQKNPAARWLVPAAALALVAGGATLTQAQADGGLPPKSAEELLVALQQSKLETYSGTVSSTVDLGLGALPVSTSRTTDFQNLANGENTVRVWADGPTRQRIALLGQAGEADVVRNGASVWTWNAEQQTATHATLPAHQAKARTKPSPEKLPATPQEAAEQALAHLDPTTEVTTSGLSSVAGRDTYSLTLTPRTDKTLVQKVVLDLDGASYAPLRVRVLSTALDKPAVDVGFTEFSTEAPAASVFTFTPPKGATVKQLPAEHKAKHPAGGTVSEHPARPSKAARPASLHVGEGWGSVSITKVPADALTKATKPASDAPAAATDPAALLAALPTRSGAWGSGKVFEGTLFTAVLTSDGRLAVGAVPAEQVEAALATPAAKALTAK